MATTTDIISIKQALEHMHSGQPFSCEVYTYDRKRKTGGEIASYPEAQLLGAGDEPEAQEEADIPAPRPGTRMEQLQQQLKEDKLQRKPNHRRWYTRNIRILQDGHPTGIIKKIHPALLRKFNGKIVAP